MDIREFVKFAKSDQVINAFLEQIADNLTRGSAPCLETRHQYLDIPDWIPVVGVLLFLALPWVRMGLQIVELQRLKLEKQLKKHAQEKGIDPELLDKAIPPFMDRFIEALGDGRLQRSLTQVLDQIEDEHDSRAK